MPIGTARMASLCLPNSELHIGTDWNSSQALLRAVSDPQRPALLLYPSEDASEMAQRTPPCPVTLVVVDGTWSQTKKMLRQNTVLGRLPRVAVQPSHPSEYRIRREPRPDCVSTIEALMFVLGKLEGQPDRFFALLEPFRWMIDRQIEQRKLNRTLPSRHVIQKKPRQLSVPLEFRDRKDDIVCVVGEANAWPWRAAGARTAYPDELVHWVAKRISTGELFEGIVAPRNPLAPNTTKHVALTTEELLSGGTIDELLARWQGFVRHSDILCSWGCYATGLLAASGGYLPSLRFDLRALAKDLLKRNIGTLERFLASIDACPCTSPTRGRAGVRLGQLAHIANCICAGAIGAVHPH